MFEAKGLRPQLHVGAGLEESGMCVTAFLPSLRSHLPRVSLFPDRIHQDLLVPADHLIAPLRAL